MVHILGVAASAGLELGLSGSRIFGIPGRGVVSLA